MNNKTAITLAATLGTIAFNEGRSCVPVLDSKLMDIIKENCVEIGSSIKFTSAFSEAWHAANLSA